MYEPWRHQTKQGHGKLKLLPCLGNIRYKNLVDILWHSQLCKPMCLPTYQSSGNGMAPSWYITRWASLSPDTATDNSTVISFSFCLIYPQLTLFLPSPFHSPLTTGANLDPVWSQLSQCNRPSQFCHHRIFCQFSCSFAIYVSKATKKWIYPWSLKAKRTTKLLDFCRIQCLKVQLWQGCNWPPATREL